MYIPGDTITLSRVQLYVSFDCDRLLLEKGAIPTIHVDEGCMIPTPRKQRPKELTAKEQRRIVREITSPE